MIAIPKNNLNENRKVISQIIIQLNGIQNSVKIPKINSKWNNKIATQCS